MSNRTLNRIVFLWVIILGTFGSQAQNEISNPYSAFGIGIVNKYSNGILDGMGSTSYAIQNPYYINFRNPASYAAFDSLSFVADAAASIYVSTLASGDMVQKNSYARPGYITIGLPVTRHWRTSVGVVPYSSVGYDVENTGTFENVGDVSYAYSAKGGLNQLYWGNAFKICKGLSIGLNASYMFGTVYYVRNTSFDGSNFYNSYINASYHLDGIHLTGGLQYMFNVKENHKIGLGVVYGNTAYIWAKEKLLISYYKGTYSLVTTYDTVYYNDNTRGNLYIPQSVGGGVSYTFKDKFTVAADVTWNNWAKYKSFGQSDSLQNAITASVGAQFIPDPTSNKFVKRMNFRVGARYSTGDLFLHSKPIDEFGVSLGIGIPLSSFNTHSSVNVVFEYGKLGTILNNLVRQNYFRFTINFTLQEKWYQRMKLE